MSSFFQELKRRNVFRVAAAYAVVAWVLVQIGEAVFPAFDVPAAIFRGMVILLVLGFPVALIFAWAFEKTPEGIKLEKNVDRSQSITRETGRKLDRMIIVVLIVSVGVLLADKFMPGTSAPVSVAPEEVLASQQSGAVSGSQSAAAKSVAVLPFADMSAAGDQEYFSDGLADSLLHALAQVRDLKVAARTSSFAFKGKNLDIREIGRQLGVSSVLEGSVQKAGNRLRVITQLIDVDDGSHLWSETFDRTDEDIFAIQDEISAAVVKALKVSLGSDEAQRLSQRATSDIQAFDLYLLGRHEFEKRRPEALEKAVAHFQQAVMTDPDYALAYAGLADSWMFLSRQNYGDLSIQDAAGHAKPYLDRALALDANSSEVYASLGLYLDEFRQAGEFPGMTAIMALEKSVQLNPANVLALTWLAIRYQGDGQYEKSANVLHRAFEMDPLNRDLLVNMSWWTTMGGDKEQGKRYLAKTMEQDPDNPENFRWASTLDYFNGDLDSALKASLRAQELEPANRAYMLDVAGSCISLRAFDCAKAWVEQARRTAPEAEDVLRSQAELNRVQGDLDAAAALHERRLDQALAGGGNWAALDVRFAALGLAEVRLQHGDYAEAAALYERVFPTLREKLSRNDVFNAEHFLGMAWAYRNLEQPDREQAVLEAAAHRIRAARLGGRSVWYVSFYESLLDAHAGDKAGAEALFRKAVDDGYPGDWDAANRRLGELLGFSDAYREAMGQLEARLAAQRAAAARDIELAITRASL